MKTNKLPKFEDSDAAVFLRALELGGDTQVIRHFVKSMRIWDKELLSAIDREKGQERE